MLGIPADMDFKQYAKDNLLSEKGYSLDDRFVIRDGKIHPVAIICPGGGYGMVCSFIEGTPFARKLNELGISAFIVYYRVKEAAKFPAPIEDLARAVAEIQERKEEYQIDMSSYSVWGSSAGGHLVACYGLENIGYKKYNLPKPKALVLVYPVISMDKSLTHMGSHDLLLGENASEELEELTSVEKQVTVDYPDTFIWCGDADKTVDPRNTKLMSDALFSNGVRYECHVYEGVDHGVGPGSGTNAQGWMDSAVSFWLGKKKIANSKECRRNISCRSGWHESGK